MVRLAAVFLGVMSMAFAQRAPLVNIGPQTPVVNTGVRPVYGHAGNHVQNLGTSVSGFGPKNYGYRRGMGQPRTIVIPYGVPVYYGDPSAYGAQPYQDQQPAPNITVVTPPPQTPMVIINQGYVPERANPVLRDYSNSELPETPDSGAQPQPNVRVYQAPMPTAAAPASQPENSTIYLIALKDGTIHSAVGYFLQGNTFGFVGTNESITRVSLDQLDRETTQRLNTERHVNFELRD